MASRVPEIERFRSWLGEERGVQVGDYRALYEWSVEDLEGFWAAVWDYFAVPAATPPERVLASDAMPGAVWFPGATLNYVDQVLRHASLPGLAIVDESEPRGGPAADVRGLTWPQLAGQVGALAGTLAGLGVEPGDRVAGYVPNIPEAIVAFLATASLGAIWSACGQDYAPAAAADRLGQLRPTVLVTADGYRHAGRVHDRREGAVQLAGAVGAQAVVMVPRLGEDPPAGVVAWAEAVACERPARPVAVPFDHPLWVLFSSGTTGRPKGIVHGHGGVVLEHLKQIALHADLAAGERFLWYTSPSWMMWNFQVAGLLVGATVVTYDGSPAAPSPDALWAIAARDEVAFLGTSPAYLLACQKAGVRPGDHDLSRLRTLGVTGSVLPASACRWAQAELGDGVTIGSISGGTDVVSGFVGSTPTVPTWPGELSAPYLGVALDAWDAEGRPVRGEVGELVVTAPMPSMPVGFWDDPDGSRYHDAYFSTFPGVWRHGDWITITDRGSVVIHGRSDSTLNRNGIRMGSAEIYQAVESLPEVAESLVVGVEQPDGGYWMPLFVALAPGVDLDDHLRGRIRQAVRDRASPRHVPDDIISVRGVPHTRTGKKLEVPIKRVLQGAPVDSVLDPGAVDDPLLLA
ncbi:MAG: acetoacetate--CoA ligase, partial [Acidimicrobiales bacterium]